MWPAKRVNKHLETVPCDIPFASHPLRLQFRRSSLTGYVPRFPDKNSVTAGYDPYPTNKPIPYQPPYELLPKRATSVSKLGKAVKEKLGSTLSNLKPDKSRLSFNLGKARPDISPGTSLSLFSSRFSMRRRATVAPAPFYQLQGSHMLEDALADASEEEEEEEVAGTRVNVASGGVDLAVGVAVATDKRVELNETEAFPLFGMR